MAEIAGKKKYGKPPNRFRCSTQCVYGLLIFRENYDVWRCLLWIPVKWWWTSGFSIFPRFPRMATNHQFPRPFLSLTKAPQRRVRTMLETAIFERIKSRTIKCILFQDGTVTQEKVELGQVETGVNPSSCTWCTFFCHTVMSHVVVVFLHQMHLFSVTLWVEIPNVTTAVITGVALISVSQKSYLSLVNQHSQNKVKGSFGNIANNKLSLGQASENVYPKHPHRAQAKCCPN